MNENEKIQRIDDGHAQWLLAFYNGLSTASKRTFRPLGETTTLAVCEGIIRDNHPGIDDKHDLVVVVENRIVGWGFLHNLSLAEPVLGLAIADDWQGRGLGSAVLDAIMAEAHARCLARITLTAVQDNALAKGMYEQRGFVCCGEFVGEDGLSYHHMVAQLIPRDNR